MSRFIVRAIWGAWFGATFLFACHETPGRQLASFLIGIALLGLILLSALWAPISWLRGRGFSVRLPLASAAWLVVGGLVAIGIARPVRAWTFRRDLPRYEKAAIWVQDQEIGGWNIQLPGEWTDLGSPIWARRDDECGLRIYFHWGGGFPVKHIARVYSPNVSLVDRPACQISRWPDVQRLAANWYEVSD
jgi:hypothetical protein